MHADNSTHLATDARHRSEQTLARARQALAEMVEDGQPLTISAFAARAGVSRAWIYTQPELRQQIMAQPGGKQPRTHAAATGTPASDASLRQRLTLARQRIGELSDENSQLREQIARLHGQLRAAKITGPTPVEDTVHDTNRQLTTHTDLDNWR